MSGYIAASYNKISQRSYVFFFFASYASPSDLPFDHQLAVNHTVMRMRPNLT